MMMMVTSGSGRFGGVDATVAVRHITDQFPATDLAAIERYTTRRVRYGRLVWTVAVEHDGERMTARAIRYELCDPRAGGELPPFDAADAKAAAERALAQLGHHAAREGGVR